MTASKRSLQRLSFATLLQELHDRIQMASVPPDQQPALRALAINILHTWAKQEQRPLPGRDLQEIRGQAHVKRALEVAAAGGHNLLLVGPAGAGKAMLARALPGLLAGPEDALPFREVHSQMNERSLFGDQHALGELTLAHTGVLLLTDLGLATPSVMQTVAQTMQTHVMTILSPQGEVMRPAHFQLVATMLACPCGWIGNPVQACHCETQEIRQYWRRLRNTLSGCFELAVEVPLQTKDLLSKHPEESSGQVRGRVRKARDLQASRYAGASHLAVNADLCSALWVEQYAQMDSAAQKLLGAAIEQLHLAAGEVLSFLRVARTIADLAAREVIGASHLAEAIAYRPRWQEN